MIDAVLRQVTFILVHWAHGTISQPTASLARLLSWAALTIVLLLADSTAKTEVIHIADPNLDQAIREALGKPTGDLTEDDLQQLIVLSAPRREIATLDGFSAAPHLLLLDLSFNYLSTVTLTPGFSSALTVDLRGNGITNFTVTGRLPSLTQLLLSENLLSDVAFLRQTPQLTDLELDYNDLTDFDPGMELSELVWLNLAFNRIRSLSFLAQLPRLSSLFLDENGLQNVELPTILPTVTWLGLAVNRISDLSFLTQLPKLEKLDLASNFARQYVFPDGLFHLQYVNLGENRLTNVVFSPDMTNLTTLFLDDNRFTAFPNLISLYSLRTLDLDLNQLTQISIPYTLTNLTALEVGYNPLETLVLPEVLATNSLAALVSDLANRGVKVLTYPITPCLVNPGWTPNGRFAFTLRGPPGAYDVLRSADLSSWSLDGSVTNETGQAEYSADAPVQAGGAYFLTRLR